MKIETLIAYVVIIYVTLVAVSKIYYGLTIEGASYKRFLLDYDSNCSKICENYHNSLEDNLLKSFAFNGLGYSYINKIGVLKSENKTYCFCEIKMDG